MLRDRPQLAERPAPRASVPVLAAVVAAIALPSLTAGGAPLAADVEAPASPVRYTEAREHELRPTVELSGTVEAPRSSVVATEVAGVVARLAVREGDRVAAGQALASLRREPVELRLEAARGQLAEAEARLKSARLKLERIRELLASEVVSQQQVDDASYETEAWEGKAAQLRAEVARLERDLELTTVRAPFAGVVSHEHTHEGQWLDLGAPVATVLALDPLEVRLEVPERYFGELLAGAVTEVRFDSAPGLRGRGRVRAVVPSADPRARTFPVLVTLEKPDRRVAAGMLAQVALPVGGGETVTIVPKDAIVGDGRTHFLYRLEDDGSVQRTEVEVGAGAGGWVAVAGDVRAGQKVVVRGNERLVSGQQVAGAPLEVPLP